MKKSEGWAQVQLKWMKTKKAGLISGRLCGKQNLYYIKW
jgi:hypothetical protein